VGLEQLHPHDAMMPVLLLPLLLLLGVGLITVAEVTKALQAKEEEKTRRAQQQLLQQVVQTKHAGGRTGSGDDSQPQQVADGSLDQVLLLLCDHHPIPMVADLLPNLSVSPLFSCSSQLCSSSRPLLY